MDRVVCGYNDSYSMQSKIYILWHLKLPTGWVHKFTTDCLKSQADMVIHKLIMLVV